MEYYNKGALANKSYFFALDTIYLYKVLVFKQKEFVLSKQLLRSGTAIGALIREAEFAQSKKDFLNKMNIALKEANETAYWLSLLKDSGYLEAKSFEKFDNKIQELTKMLISTVRTLRKNMNL